MAVKQVECFSCWKLYKKGQGSVHLCNAQFSFLGNTALAGRQRKIRLERCPEFQLCQQQEEKAFLSKKTTENHSSLKRSVTTLVLHVNNLTTVVTTHGNRERIWAEKLRELIWRQTLWRDPFWTWWFYVPPGYQSIRLNHMRFQKFKKFDLENGNTIWSTYLRNSACNQKCSSGALKRGQG